MRVGDRVRFKQNLEIGVGTIVAIDSQGMAKVEFDLGGHFYGHYSNLDQYFDIVQQMAQQVAPILGMSTAEAEFRINQIIKPMPVIPSEVTQKLEKLREDERWRTDPMQIGKWLDRLFEWIR